MWQMHIVSGYIGGFTFSVLRGMGLAKPFTESMGPEDILNGKSVLCSTRKRRSQTVILSDRSGWQGNILEFSFIFSTAEECPCQSLLT